VDVDQVQAPALLHDSVGDHVAADVVCARVLGVAVDGDLEVREVILLDATRGEQARYADEGRIDLRRRGHPGHRTLGGARGGGARRGKIGV
jgi:hypothetical protein